MRLAQQQKVQTVNNSVRLEVGGQWSATRVSGAVPQPGQWARCCAEVGLVGMWIGKQEVTDRDSGRLFDSSGRLDFYLRICRQTKFSLNFALFFTVLMVDGIKEQCFYPCCLCKRFIPNITYDSASVSQPFVKATRTVAIHRTQNSKWFKYKQSKMLFCNCIFLSDDILQNDPYLDEAP